jgi:hypothetical protein
LEKKFKECEKGDDITPFDGSLITVLFSTPSFFVTIYLQMDDGINTLNVIFTGYFSLFGI